MPGAYTTRYEYGAVSQGAKTQEVSLVGYCVTDDFHDFYASIQCGIGGFTTEYPYNVVYGFTGYIFQSGGQEYSTANNNATYGQYYQGPPLECDRTHQFRAHVHQYNDGDWYGST